MKIIDMHCDTIMECYAKPNHMLFENQGHISIDTLKKGDALAQFFALFIDTEGEPEKLPYDIFTGMYQTYKAQLSLNKEFLQSAYTVADILKNRDKGIISSILAVEDGVIIDGKIERVKEIFDMGVRLVTLTWNHENSIGYPCRDETGEHMRGLKPFGIEVVNEMNKLGMLIDVSHLSEGGFWDVAKHSKKPFIASHSCARAICDHRRNLTDEQLKAIGNSGGLIGVNFYSEFLKEASALAEIAHIVEHIKYISDKAGIEAVGLGSDFDGIDCELEFKDYAGFPMIIDALAVHYTEAQIEMICNKNAFRVLKDVFGA